MWLVAAAIAFAVGLVALFALRQGFDPPPQDFSPPPSGPALPDSLPPALAGAVLGRGHPTLEHAAAALFALADRGHLRVEQGPRGPFGIRRYRLVRMTAHHPPAAHESAALDLAFGADAAVSLTKARGRLTRRFRRFARAARADMEALGLFDRDRQATRRNYGRVAAAASLLAGLSVAAWGAWLQTHGPRPLAVTAALACAGALALIVYATTTPLSNDGARRAARWRAYKAYLQEAAREKERRPAAAPDTLPYVVALGLASEWSKRLQRDGAPSPPWFNATDDPEAFPTFVATAGAGLSGKKEHG